MEFDIFSDECPCVVNIFVSTTGPVAACLSSVLGLPAFSFVKGMCNGMAPGCP